MENNIYTNSLNSSVEHTAAQPLASLISFKHNPPFNHFSSVAHPLLYTPCYHIKWSPDKKKSLPIYSFNIIRQRLLIPTLKVHVFIIGTGNVAQSLISQIQSFRTTLQEEKAIDIVICGLLNTRTSSIEPNGIDLDYWPVTMIPFCVVDQHYSFSNKAPPFEDHCIQ